MKQATQYAIIGTFGLIISQIFNVVFRQFMSDLLTINTHAKFLLILSSIIIIFQLLGFISILNFFIQFKKNIIEKDEVLEIGKK
jgi:hypothetical protein